MNHAIHIKNGNIQRKESNPNKCFLWRCACIWHTSFVILRPKELNKEAMRSKTKIDTSEAWSHKHDFPIEEVGNTNKAIARLIVSHLQAFKALDKYGSPPDFTDI